MLNSWSLILIALAYLGLLFGIAWVGDRKWIARAIETGLKFRPLPDTARATLAWFDSLPADAQKSLSDYAMSPEREAKLLEAWKKHKG